MSPTLEGALGVYKDGGETSHQQNRSGTPRRPKPHRSWNSAAATHTVTVKGSLILAVSDEQDAPHGRSHGKASKGRQKPESFVGGPKAILEESINGESFAQAGLSVLTHSENKETAEVSSAA